LIWVQFDPTQAGFQLVEKAPWLPGFDINYHVGVDGISLWFVLLSTLLTVVVVLGSWHSVTSRVKEYMIAFLVMNTLMVGVFTALDVVLFYLFFEGILIPMFLIIGIWGGPNRIYAAFKFFLYTLAGSVLFLIAIDMVFARHSGLRGATASERAEAHEREDISIFPLAFPLIAGPGAITTVLLMASDSAVLAERLIRLGVILAVLLLTLASLLLTARIVKVLGETGANVIDRLLGLILSAIAVQFVVDGVRQAFGLG